MWFLIHTSLSQPDAEHLSLAWGRRVRKPGLKTRGFIRTGLRDKVRGRRRGAGAVYVCMFLSQELAGRAFWRLGEGARRL